MEKKSRNNFFIIFTISLALLLTNLDISIVNIALPTLSRTYNADMDAISRVILFYVIGMASFLPVFGKLSDITGSEKIFKWGFILFAFFSLLCGLSPNLLYLNIFRFLKGVAAAMLLSNFAAIVIKYLPVDFRGRAFGFAAIFGGIGVALGPPLGGLIIKHLSWQWIFLIKLPLGILALFLNRMVLTAKQTQTEKKHKFDIKGAVFSIACLMIFVYLLNSASTIDWLSPLTIGLALAFFALFILFIRQERIAEDPLLDLSYFKNKHLIFALAGSFLFLLIFDGLLLVFPFFFELTKGFSPDKTGFILMISAFISLVFSPLSGYIADKYTPTLATRTAMLIFIVSNFLFLNIIAETSLSYIMLAFFLLGFSMALFFASNTVIIMSYAEKGKEGMLSALSSINIYIAAIIGISVFQTVFSHGYNISNISDSNINQYIDQLSAGYSNSVILAIILSVIGFFTSLFTRKNLLVKENKNAEN